VGGRKVDEGWWNFSFQILLHDFYTVSRIPKNFDMQVYRTDIQVLGRKNRVGKPGFEKIVKKTVFTPKFRRQKLGFCLKFSQHRLSDRNQTYIYSR
jgi:hypothetical protein